MNENEIDNTYLDETFCNLINSLDDEKLIAIVNYILENYDADINFDKISNFSKAIYSLFGKDFEANHLYRQIKYLINKGIYNRLLKKFKNDLILLNLKESKIDLIIELIKEYLEKINIINKNKLVEENNLIIKDISVITEMPICTTQYVLKNEIGGINENLKKQSLILKLNLNCKSNLNKNLIFDMDKHQLIDFYEQVEKIQEKLDKLY